MPSPWVPLEANPALFAAWCTKLGLDTSQYTFHDVFGLDDELLAMVPQPAEAVLLLYPITSRSEAQREQEDMNPPMPVAHMLWFPQTIGNACGTIGLLHAIANSRAWDAVGADTPLAKLLTRARHVAPEERSRLLEASQELSTAHAAVAEQGQTEAPDAQDDVNLHFVALVRSPTGQLVELDGRRRGPLIRANDVPADGLLPAAAHFIRAHYMAQDPEQVQFSIVALGPSM
ncbi:ubiquitinyl hydrolase 1 [Malassezia pachydermatis]|uniref:Ubiquitin carboxyl-terminal hydrolase n=1 Tax=Malassezia pachydermatis TaxID=77020 RepID=A0A0M8MVB7_9BASI|nr:ubiquitin carboxyl-terminal hydrolase isozyme l3-like protein [Malassezia pachydermatis]KOS14321.1 ubiquitin carboxyl-terminal hydrolase isozyme l3-like protein [Malassezia pachydermatis]